jgi:hypothetical protein
VRVEKTGITGITENVYSSLVQMSQQLLLFVNLVDNLLGPGQQPGKIYLRPLAHQAVLGKLLGVANEPGRFGQNTGGHAAIVGAGSAQVAPLYQGYPCSQFAGVQGCGYSRRPAAYDNHLISV